MDDESQRKRTLLQQQRQTRVSADESARQRQADTAAINDEPVSDEPAAEPRVRRQQLNQSRRQQEQQAAAAQVAGAAGGTVNRYRTIQRAVDGVKLLTGGLGSIGEVFFSAWVFIFVAHGEWLYSSFVNPQYKIAWWKKVLVILADLLIFTILLFLVTLVGTIGYLFTHPLETIKIVFGAAWEGLKNLIGGFFGAPTPSK